MSRYRLTPRLVLAAIAGPAAVAPAAAFGAGTVLWQDNFESYANQGALLSAYAGNGSSNTGGPTSQFFDLGVPTPDGGNTTQSVRYHDPLPSGQTMPVLARDVNAGAATASDSAPILWQYDYYWDGGTNKRVASGLRNIGGAGNQTGLLEMGFYNSAYDPRSGGAGTVSGFAVRTVLITGSGSLPEASVQNWRFLTLDSDPTKLLAQGTTAGTWIRFSALIRGKAIEYTADIDRDGSIDSHYTATATGFDVSHSVFNNVRFGGPSGLGSAGGGAYFDNLLVRTLVPGDANANGKIDPDDYALVDRGAAKALTGWTNGDFNNDGVVDAADYLLIDTSYSQQLGNAPAGLLAQRAAEFGDDYVASLLAAVPEPTSLLAACGLALPLLSRRRTRL